MTYVLLLISLLAASRAYSLELSDYIKLVEKSNKELEAQASEVKAKSFKSTIRATPDEPMVALSRETMIMETDYVMLSQQLRFPLKYLYEARLGHREKDMATIELEQLKLQKRAQAKALYFSLFSLAKTQELLEANKSTLREYARVAESRYASGQALQSDAMGAHVLTTMTEMELLDLEAKKQKVMAQMQLLAGGELDASEMKFPAQLTAPKLLEMDPDLKRWVQQTPQYQLAENQVSQSELEKSLANYEFAPDFSVSYKKSISGALEDSEMLSIGFSVPLWFWKPSSQIAQARANLNKAKSLRRQKELELQAAVKVLIAEVKTQSQLLEISKTSLIPQAETSFRVAGANYRSGRGDFGTLRDSERDYYEVQRQYFSKLESYVQKLVELEALIGKEIASWK